MVEDEKYVFPMTVITPVISRRMHRVRQRFILFGGRHWPSVVLAGLRFIHVAHWAGLKRLPGSGKRTSLPTPYLVFVSNFNGARNEYIEMFSDRIPFRINVIYGHCVGFPGAQPASGLIAYLERHHHDAALYYAAYPEATTRMVASALEVQRELRDLRARAAALPHAALSGEWTSFLDRVRGHLW